MVRVYRVIVCVCCFYDKRSPDSQLNDEEKKAAQKLSSSLGTNLVENQIFRQVLGSWKLTVMP